MNGETFSINEVSFASLVFIIRGALDYSDPKDPYVLHCRNPNQERADVITGKYILQCSYLVYHVFPKEWYQISSSALETEWCKVADLCL